MNAPFFATLVLAAALGSCVRNSSSGGGLESSRLASFAVKIPVKLGERTVTKVILSYEKENAEKAEQVFAVDAQKPGEILNEKFRLEPGKYAFEVKAYNQDTVVGASRFCKEEQKKTSADIREGENDVVLFVCEGSETPGPSETPVPTAR